MIRVLITGPTGFIGRRCLERLLDEDVEIHAANRGGSGPGQRVHWHAADLRNASEAAALISAVSPTHLFHLAWEAKPPNHMNSPDNLAWLEASLAMAAAFGRNGGQRFLGVGTAIEYAAGYDYCHEDETPIQPSSLYGQSKAACWAGIQAEARRYGFSAAWGRLFIAYDRDDPSPRLIPAILAALNRKAPVETTDGLQLRDFIHARDAADLLVRLLLSAEEGAFNIGTGQAIQIRFVIEYLAKQRGALDLLRIGAIPRRAGDPQALVADAGKVRASLGWVAPTSIEEGLKSVLGSD